MKNLLYLFVFLFSFTTYAQFEANENLTISEKQNDDIYLAGETIKINAQIDGDAVIAGAKITVRDTINQDLIVAGGNINVKGHINDDIRAAGGDLIIDTTVKDDVIVFGGKVVITEDAIIHGNLIAFSGDIEVNGTINGAIKAYGGELQINGNIAKNAELYAGELEINGKIGGSTKMVAEDIKIGNNATFSGNIDYWCESGEIDFKNSLVNVTANFNEDLAEDRREFPLHFFGIAALGLWLFYILSAFLIILIFNASFKKFWTNTIEGMNNNILKSLGYGLIYIFGIPLIIILCFVILIGIPIGLFIVPLYLFSMLIGHLVFALLIAHYINKRHRYSWGFWKLSFVTLGIAILIRVITFIPFLGGLISIAIIALAYGLIVITLLGKKNPVKLVEVV